MDDDQVFKALADPTRRHLLDRLFERDGRTLTELESELEMTRFGVMKHLRVLEDAGLVVTRREGREKLHFLNPVPIRLIHDRWIDKYTEHRVAALADLKHELEERRMTTMTAQTTQVYPSSSARPRSRSGTRSRSRSSRSSTSTAPASTSRDGRRFAAVGDAGVGRGGARVRPAAQAGARVGLGVRLRAGGRGAEPRHLGDRAPGRRHHEADRRARPARGRAEDGRERRRRLDVRPRPA